MLELAPVLPGRDVWVAVITLTSSPPPHAIPDTDVPMMKYIAFAVETQSSLKVQR